MGYLEVRVASLYDEKVLGAKDRIALARKLQEKGDNIAAGQMVSGWYVPNTGGAALGALQNIIGAYQESGAREDLDKAEREKTAATMRMFNSAGIRVPEEMALQAGTPEQKPSWWDKTSAFVTGGEQPQTVPAKPLEQNVAQNVTPDQFEQLAPAMALTSPELAPTITSIANNRFTRATQKEIADALRTDKREQFDISEQGRNERAKEAIELRKIIAEQSNQTRETLAAIAASARQQNQGSESSYTPVTFENGERGRFNRKTGEYEPVTNLPSDLTNKATKGLSQAASNSLEYGTRMQDADAVIEKVGTSYAPWKLKASEGVTNVPILGSAATAMLPVNEQLLKQAKESFIHAKLRKESGAKIDPNEFEAADRIYFPQPKDSAEVLAQKAASRKSAIEGVLSAVPKDQRPAIGGALGGESPVPVATTRPPVQQQMPMQPPVQQQMPMQPPVQQAPAKPQSLQPGEVYKGHVYLGGDLSNPASWRAQ
jgi:hypothetical protein